MSTASLKTHLILVPVAGTDADDDPVNPLVIATALRATGLDRWPGRESALEEIEAGPVAYREDLEKEPDDTIAGYLLLTRADLSDRLPDLACCEVSIQAVKG